MENRNVNVISEVVHNMKEKLASCFSAIFAALVASLLVVMLSSCQTPATQHSSSSPEAEASLNIHLIVDRYEFNSPASMCTSILTAEVQTVSYGKSRWNTPDGLRPHMAPASHSSLAETLVAEGYRIYTPVHFGTMRILHDRRRQATQAFVTVGGQVGSDQFWIIGFPQLQPNGHYVLVFAPGLQPPRGRQESWLEVYDAFPVDAHGIVTLQQPGAPAEPGPGQPQPAVQVALSLSSLQQHLANCN